MSAYLARDVPSIERYIVNHLEYSLARTRHSFDRFGAYQATALSVRDRLIESWNDTQQYFTDTDGAVGAGLRSGRGRGRGARSRPGQRRFGEVGGLLPGLDRHAQLPRLGIRHPLQVWHVRAAHPQRPTDGGARLLADARQPVRDRAPRRQVSGVLRWARLPVHRPPGPPPLQVGGRGGGPPGHRVRARLLQHRRLLRQPGGASDQRVHLGGAVPERQHRRRQGASPQAAVLFRVGHAAGRHPPLPEATASAHRAAVASERATQRHAPHHRHRGADAHPARRLCARLDRGLEHRHRGLLLHQPHGAARGVGKVAGAADGARAAAPHAAHLRDQLPPPAAICQALQQRRRGAGAGEHHRGGHAQARAHGAAGGGRHAHRERRGGDPHADRARAPLPRFLPLRTAEIRQHHQRGDAAPLAARGEPGAERGAVALDRERRVDPGAVGAARTGAVRRQSGPAARIPRGQAGEQAPPRRVHPEPARRAGGRERAVRRAGEAHPRVQAAAAEYPRGHRALQPDQGRSARPAAAGGHLRRQGGGRVRAGQAHHPPHQRCGGGGEQRSRGGQPAQGVFPGELPGVAGGAHHSGQRHQRAHLHRGHGGVGHQQHEVCDERRSDRRHHGRRQHRDPRRDRRRQHVRVRAARRAGGRGARPAAQPRVALSGSALPGRRRPGGRRALWGCGHLRGAGARAGTRQRLLPGEPRFHGLHGGAGTGGCGVPRPALVAAQVHRQHQPHGQVQLRPQRARVCTAHLEAAADAVHAI
eukprot:ctg_2260.g738